MIPLIFKLWYISPWWLPAFNWLAFIYFQSYRKHLPTSAPFIYNLLPSPPPLKTCTVKYLSPRTIRHQSKLKKCLWANFSDSGINFLELWSSEFLPCSTVTTDIEESLSLPGNFRQKNSSNSFQLDRVGQGKGFSSLQDRSNKSSVESVLRFFYSISGFGSGWKRLYKGELNLVNRFKMHKDT